jgi:hypothetical protein
MVLIGAALVFYAGGLAMSSPALPRKICRNHHEKPHGFRHRTVVFLILGSAELSEIYFWFYRIGFQIFTTSRIHLFQLCF